ncbi:putative sulfate exporter family transporter [Chitinophaga varians]|uniref:Putative sulfate exporter family transporter n=1 Tax=Chitinophaga varians TaxID=2202339 RepID=A0A847RL74_9BACT|nr:putative sulfate exporter family transporter [Chitinophaga varians]NLR63722.1 putative sulfate exporter family transporter [Chitinophaga varians]
MQLQKTGHTHKDLPLAKIIFIAAAAATLLPVVQPPVALLLGLALAQTTGNPFAHITPKITHWLLQLSVIGLGFGMNVHAALQAGKAGFLFTVVSITGTLLLGLITGRLLKIEKPTSHLIACGTAICGGSAIAAISPVIKAGEKQISVALGIVFLLNSLALFVFPAVGHWLNLSQQQFGMWSAIAIHDTSSVVGAANKYGETALQIATTVKLSRALWIMPVAFITTLLFRNSNGKIKIPWFIGLFLLAMVLNTWVPAVSTVGPLLVHSAKTALSLTLFLIGTGLTRQAFRGIGWQPLLQGVLLWVCISVGALIAILQLVG